MSRRLSAAERVRRIKVDLKALLADVGDGSLELPVGGAVRPCLGRAVAELESAVRTLDGHAQTEATRQREQLIDRAMRVGGRAITKSPEGSYEQGQYPLGNAWLVDEEVPGQFIATCQDQECGWRSNQRENIRSARRDWARHAVSEHPELIEAAPVG